MSKHVVPGSQSIVIDELKNKKYPEVSATNEDYANEKADLQSGFWSGKSSFNFDKTVSGILNDNVTITVVDPDPVKRVEQLDNGRGFSTIIVDEPPRVELVNGDPVDVKTQPNETTPYEFKAMNPFKAIIVCLVVLACVCAVFGCIGLLVHAMKNPYLQSFPFFKRLRYHLMLLSTPSHSNKRNGLVCYKNENGAILEQRSSRDAYADLVVNLDDLWIGSEHIDPVDYDNNKTVTIELGDVGLLVLRYVLVTPNGPEYVFESTDNVPTEYKVQIKHVKVDV